MRIRYYACSFFWIYCALIAGICIRPALLSNKESFVAILSELAHPAPKTESDDDARVAEPDSNIIVDNLKIDRQQIDKTFDDNEPNDSRYQKLSPEWLNLVEKHLMTKMGLKTRPRPKRKFIIPDKLRELYDQLTAADADNDEGDNLRENVNPTWDSARSFFPEPDDSANVPTNVLTFNLSTLPSRERIEGADLALLLSDNDNGDNDYDDADAAPSSSAVYLRLSISDTVRNHTVLMDTVKVKCGMSSRQSTNGLNNDKRGNSDNMNGRWLTFDVGSAVRRWSMSQTKTGRIQVDIQSTSTKRVGGERLCGVHLADDIGNSRIGSAASRQPVLIVYTSDVGWNGGRATQLQRAKRDTSTRSRSADGSNNKQSAKQPAHRKHKKNNRQKSTNRRPELCRRRELHIDFLSVGWNDWIVAPQGYDAYYCSGECVYPLPDMLNATNHAIVQTLVHSVNPGAAPKSCCVPTELAPISMLYLDEFDKVVLKTYQDMVVVGCGCR